MTLDGEGDWIYGIIGLGQFLGVSHVTAAKIKKQVPFYLFSKRIRFQKR